MIGLDELWERAADEGFCAAGASLAEPGEEGAELRSYGAEGRHGTMAHLAKDIRRRADPRQLLAGARAVVIVAAAYDDPSAGDREATTGPRAGTIARYARARDYHEVLLDPLRQLARSLGDVGAMAYVDTGPVMEKVWAERAGLGWRGRHTLLVSRRHGCRLLLGSIVTRIDMEPGMPHQDLCGTCTRCVEACPTGALESSGRGSPTRIDPRRCRSYLTIEHRGSLDPEARRLLGDALFGCDLCLEACPWNRFAGGSAFPGLEARLPGTLDAMEIVGMDGPMFRRRFAGTPVLRARRRGLLRNAAVVLGNAAGDGDGDPAAVEALSARLATEEDSVVRAHVAWALGRHGTRRAQAALRLALSREGNPDVLREIEAALDGPR